MNETDNTEIDFDDIEQRLETVGALCERLMEPGTAGEITLMTGAGIREGQPVVVVAHRCGRMHVGPAHYMTVADAIALHADLTQTLFRLDAEMLSTRNVDRMHAMLTALDAAAVHEDPERLMFDLHEIIRDSQP